MLVELVPAEIVEEFRKLGATWVGSQPLVRKTWSLSRGWHNEFEFLHVHFFCRTQKELGYFTLGFEVAFFFPRFRPRHWHPDNWDAAVIEAMPARSTHARTLVGTPT